MAKKLKKAEPKLVQMATIPEPFLPAGLDGLSGEDKKDPDWYAKALEALATQVTFRNDFYYPLLGAAEELRVLRRVRDAFVTLVRALGPRPAA